MRSLREMTRAAGAQRTPNTRRMDDYLAGYAITGDRLTTLAAPATVLTSLDDPDHRRRGSGAPGAHAAPGHRHHGARRALRLHRDPQRQQLDRLARCQTCCRGTRTARQTFSDCAELLTTRRARAREAWRSRPCAAVRRGSQPACCARHWPALLACSGGGDDAPPNPPPPPPPPIPPRRPFRGRHRRRAQSATQILVSWTASTDAGTGVAGIACSATPDATPSRPSRPLTTPTAASTAATTYSYTRARLRRRDSGQRVRGLGRRQRRDHRGAADPAVPASTRGPRTPPASRATRRAPTSRSPCSGCSRTCPTSRSPSPCCRSPATPRAGTWCRRPARCACSTTRRTFRPRASSSTSRVAAQLRARTARTTSAACSAWHSIRTTRPTRASISSTRARHDARPRRPRLRIPQHRRWHDARSRQRARVVQRRRSGGQPQRRQHRVRPRRLPLHRHRRRRRRRTTRTARIGNGQLLTTLLGKMLRIDVSATRARRTTYTIPPTNPYAGESRAATSTARGAANCPEIYAYGFRNPVALELRSRQRRAVAQRRRPGHARGSGPGHARRQLRLALLRGHQPHSTSRPAGRTARARFRRSRSTAARQGFSTTGGFVYRGSAIPEPARPLRVRRFRQRQSLEHRARHHADAAR